MTLLAGHKVKAFFFHKDLRSLGSGLMLVLVVMVLASALVMNLERERGKDDAVRVNLETIETQARIVAVGEAADDCFSGPFSEPTIAAAIEAIGIANNHTFIQCASSPHFFSVVAARPSLGFFAPSAPFWCADSVQPVCSTDRRPDGAVPCPCTSSP